MTNKTNRRMFISYFYENSYLQDDYKLGFNYYEKTPINQIDFDEKFFVPWSFFSNEGISILLPALIRQIYKDFPYLNSIEQNFLQNFLQITQFKEVFLSSELNLKKQLLELFEFLLFNTNPELFGLWRFEEVLFNNIDYIYSHID